MNRNKSCRIHNCRQDREYISTVREVHSRNELYSHYVSTTLFINHDYIGAAL